MLDPVQMLINKLYSKTDAHLYYQTEKRQQKQMALTHKQHKYHVTTPKQHDNCKLQTEIPQHRKSNLQL